MTARAVLCALLCLAFAPAALAAPTGGIEAPSGGGTGAPDQRFSGGEDGAVAGPVAEPPPAPVEPEPVPVPEVVPPAPGPAPVAKAAQRKDDDVEVEVPVPEPTPDRPAPPERAGPLAGLASTGFAVAVLAALGMSFGVAGLWLRGLSRRPV